MQSVFRHSLINSIYESVARMMQNLGALIYDNSLQNCSFRSRHHFQHSYELATTKLRSGSKYDRGYIDYQSGKSEDTKILIMGIHNSGLARRSGLIEEGCLVHSLCPTMEDPEFQCRQCRKTYHLTISVPRIITVSNRHIECSVLARHKAVEGIQTASRCLPSMQFCFLYRTFFRYTKFYYQPLQNPFGPKQLEWARQCYNAKGLRQCYEHSFKEQL
jgi:hypothetical protein